MTEYQLYGKDGLFHSIVKASKIMKGRYAILPGGGMDLNMNNVLSGLEFPKAKYPMVCCLTPMSAFTQASVVGQWEVYNFTLFFVTTTHNTGDNKLKRPDPSTNSSLHKSPMDWSDMHQVMLGFMTALETTGKNFRAGLRIDQKGQWVVGRFTEKGNDKVSGVFIRFSASIPALCEYPDINPDDIELPDFETIDHPQHFH